jgi:putative Ca2+/H+ antiporter (TMEM165/GDT1 family)
MAYLFLSFWTILVSELICDKSIYTVMSLVMRFRAQWVYCGICAAFLGKMSIAVLFGRVLSRLPSFLLNGISAATFLFSAAWIWLKSEKSTLGAPGGGCLSWTSAVSVSFLAIFFSEWADLGQITAAALVAKSNAPGLIWLGGSLALCTKGTLAVALGLSLRERIPRHLVRALSASTCLVLAFVALCY